ncbi:MAG: FHA domain-containing protein, partial [Thermoleophilia bacterium]
PQLVVVDGRMRGASFDVPPGRSEIGRQAGVAILLDDQDVSRRHALLERTGGRVVLTDPGSTNGTWVNRRQLRAGDPRDRVELSDGDELRIGSVTLRFSMAAAGTATDVREYVFGDVHGPVQTGSGQQYVAGRDQYVAGRDQYHDNSVRVEGDYDPWDELFRGRGAGRVLMAVGGIIALVGFGMVMFFIFSAFGSSIDDFGGPGELSDPFKKELLPGVPMVAAGFGLFAVGGVLAGIGATMSKAARKREEELRERQRWQRRGPDG